MVLDVVLDAVLARRDESGWRAGLVGIDQVHLGRQLRRAGDNDEAISSGAVDVEVEPLVRLFVDEIVAVDRSAEHVTPDLPRSHRMVGTDVEHGRVVVRPRQPVVRVGDLVVEIHPLGEVVEPEHRALAAGDIRREGEAAMVG